MGRKTSAYAKKKRREGTSYNSSEWINAIVRCRQYDDYKLPGDLITINSKEAAEKSIVTVRLALEQIKNAPDDGEHCWNVLCHANGIAKIRYLQIGGDCEPVKIINASDEVLKKIRNRYLKWAKWEILESEITQLSESIDLYELVLLNSSPAQMLKAHDIQKDILLKQKAEGLVY